MRAEDRSLVPCHRGAHNTHGKAHAATHQGKQHGPIGREAGDDVAAQDAEDSAIDGCKQEGPVKADHRLAPRGEYSDCVQHNVSSKGECDAREQACNYRSNASTHTSRGTRLAYA